MENAQKQDLEAQIKELQARHQKEVEELRKVSDEYKDTLQRLQADFENFRKRLDKEKEEFSAFAGVRIVADFLPLMDSLNEGIKDAEKAGNAQMKGGFEKLRKQLRLILERNGVREIESIGKKFDHALHESVLMANEKDKDDGVVLEEFQKGYLINGKVLRPAKVRVNRKE